MLILALVATVLLPGRMTSADYEERVRRHFSARVAGSVLEAQRQIAATDLPGGFYARVYRYAEPFYWSKIAGWMAEDARHRSASRILDVGCGYGTLLAVAVEIYQGEGYCVDVNSYLSPTFADLRNLQFSKANIELESIPWPGHFDVIIMTEVLEHFNFHPLPTLKKLRQALAPGGFLYLSTPDAKDWRRTTKYYRSLSEIPPPQPGKPFVDDHVWHYTERELREVLKQAGFRVRLWDYAPGEGRRHLNVAVQ